MVSLKTFCEKLHSRWYLNESPLGRTLYKKLYYSLSLPLSLPIHAGISLVYQISILPALPLVMSPLRASMAWRMRPTSAPPTYWLLFISQLVTTRSHGLGPLRWDLT